MSTRYDRTGRTYSRTRQPDPRIAAVLDAALVGMASVANIGAGTGSYEPATTVVAVEPSSVMIAQRGPGLAPAIQAVAENLPIPTDSVDAALAILTVHHWSDLAGGLAELRRIARRRIVLLTWDHTVTREFWLLREYLPAAAETDAALAVPVPELVALLGDATVTPVPVPHDCLDGFACAYWRRPEAYLDETVRAGASMFALTPESRMRDGLAALRADLDSGVWAARHADLLDAQTLDLGYRLITVDL
ncbi:MULTISPECIES: class I SAM-dependent methyltransferase [unclassified Nocardia]|uniref:class I SAM-dependent methyltransferase n=1 Tax=unclassified Nocardia TaxID=2637762 RepID=UPI001CE463ED|nr:MULTISPECIES: class I SAM-dependent methyltransferase [unclassified Nocardia]